MHTAAKRQLSRGVAHEVELALRCGLGNDLFDRRLIMRSSRATPLGVKAALTTRRRLSWAGGSTSMFDARGYDYNRAARRPGDHPWAR